MQRPNALHRCGGVTPGARRLANTRQLHIVVDDEQPCRHFGGYDRGKRLFQAARFMDHQIIFAPTTM